MQGLALMQMRDRYSKYPKFRDPGEVWREFSAYFLGKQYYFRLPVIYRKVILANPWPPGEPAAASMGYNTLYEGQIFHVLVHTFACTLAPSQSSKFPSY